MFFFFFEYLDVSKELIYKLESFKKSLDSNDINFTIRNEKIDVINSKDGINYGLCSLKVNKISENKVSIKISKMINSNYKPIQLKSQFNRYWKENIPQKEFVIGLNEDGELKKLLYLIVGIKDTFISDVVVDFNIKEISFKDYRGFKNEKFEFNRNLTVLIGKNGCGKTSILEGIAVGIGAFLNGIDDVTDSKNIYKEDIRFSLEDTDDIIVRNDYPPTKVCFKSKFINQEINWSRTKASLEGARTSTKDSNIVTTPVRQLVDDIRNRDSEIKRNIILPVFSYHGVGRVANYTRNMNTLEKAEKISRFVGYKDCLKVASNYKFFIDWYRKMKFREFENSKKILVLEAVEKAIKKTLVMLTESELDKVKDIRFFEGEIAIVFENENIIPISYLSDGYKDIIGIVSDIAYRMAILNPQLGKEILDDTPGIVLIDEIEVHLHPKWQQSILRILKEIFPKVQFIITTHSPMVVSTTLENEAIELEREGDKVVYSRVGNPQEWYMSDILRNVFGVTERFNKNNIETNGMTIEEKLKEYSDLVKEYTVNKDNKIKEKIKQLYEEVLPSVPEDSPRRRVVERLKGLIE